MVVIGFVFNYFHQFLLFCWERGPWDFSHHHSRTGIQDRSFLTFLQTTAVRKIEDPVSVRVLQNVSDGVVVFVQLPSCVRPFVTLWTAACQASLSLTTCQSLPTFMSVELVMPSAQLILCRPLLLSSIFPRIKVFSNESAVCIRWPKYWGFSINRSNEYSGLISFRISLQSKGHLIVYLNKIST